MKRIIMARLHGSRRSPPFRGSDDGVQGLQHQGARRPRRRRPTSMQMAKVKRSRCAQKAALGDRGSGASIVKGGLEIEDGCLVYSYHVKGAGEKGQTEVLVDAGNGNDPQAASTEGALRAAIEKPVDKTKELASKAKDKVSGRRSRTTPSSAAPTGRARLARRSAALLAPRA